MSKKEFKVGDLVAQKPKRDYVADHARRSLRKFGLSKEHAAFYVKLVKAGVKAFELASILGLRLKDGVVDLSQFSRGVRLLAKPSDLLIDSFCWQDAFGKLGEGASDSLESMFRAYRGSGK